MSEMPGDTVVEVERYTVRSVSGYSEIIWALRQIIRRCRSGAWPTVKATVEGYEYLGARMNGWLVIFYSYEFAAERYPGELRKWSMFWYVLDDGPIRDAITRFPRGSQIDIRVDPKQPARSVGGP